MADEVATMNPRVPFVALLGLAAIYVIGSYAGYMAWSTAFLLANVFVAAAIVYAGVWRFVEEHVAATATATEPVAEVPSMDNVGHETGDGVADSDDELVVLSSKKDD